MSKKPTLEEYAQKYREELEVVVLQEALVRDFNSENHQFGSKTYRENVAEDLVQDPLGPGLVFLRTLCKLGAAMPGFSCELQTGPVRRLVEDYSEPFEPLTVAIGWTARNKTRGYDLVVSSRLKQLDKEAIAIIVLHSIDRLLTKLAQYKNENKRHLFLADIDVLSMLKKDPHKETPSFAPTTLSVSTLSFPISNCTTTLNYPTNVGSEIMSLQNQMRTVVAEVVAITATPKPPEEPELSWPPISEDALPNHPKEPEL